MMKIEFVSPISGHRVEVHTDAWADDLEIVEARAYNRNGDEIRRWLMYADTAYMLADALIAAANSIPDDSRG